MSEFCYSVYISTWYKGRRDWGATAVLAIGGETGWTLEKHDPRYVKKFQVSGCWTQKGAIRKVLAKVKP